MSVKAMAAVWGFSISPTAKLVALALAEGGTGDDDVYDADVAYIVRMTGLGETEIREAFVEMVDAGALDRVDLLTFRFRFA